MKKLLTPILALALLLACALPALAASDDVSVTVDGAPVVWTDARPFIDDNNRTLCPLRVIGETMGLTVTWDDATRTATFTSTDIVCVNGTRSEATRSISFPIDSNQTLIREYRFDADSNLRYYEGFGPTMDTAAIIRGDRTYAPVRFMAEFFHSAVEWDGDTRTVSITCPGYTPGGAALPLNVTRQDYSLYDAAGDMLLDAYYDLVTVTADSGAAAKINETTAADLARFVKEYNELDIDTEHASINGPYEFTCAATPMYNQNGYLSLCYETGWYMGGVFNGGYYGKTFDTATGELLSVGDCFKMSDEDLLLYIKQILFTEIRYNPDDFFDDAADKVADYTLDSFDFYLAADGELIVCIPVYELSYGYVGPLNIRAGIYAGVD